MTTCTSVVPYSYGNCYNGWWDSCNGWSGWSGATSYAPSHTTSTSYNVDPWTRVTHRVTNWRPQATTWSNGWWSNTTVYPASCYSRCDTWWC